MTMKFEHEIYGFKIKDLSKDKEAEPHCSLILKLNNMERIDKDTFELTCFVPVNENIELLQDLKKSCEILIEKLKVIDKE